MTQPTPDVTLPEQPQLPAEDFGELIHQLKCLPTCKICYGQGYVGFRKLPAGGGMQLVKCPNAVWGETDFVKMLKYLTRMNNNVVAMGEMLQYLAIRVNTPWYSRLYQWLRMKKTKMPLTIFHREDASVQSESEKKD